jgi:hypothetical protein
MQFCLSISNGYCARVGVLKAGKQKANCHLRREAILQGISAGAGWGGSENVVRSRAREHRRRRSTGGECRRGEGRFRGRCGEGGWSSTTARQESVEAAVSEPALPGRRLLPRMPLLHRDNESHGSSVPVTPHPSFSVRRATLPLFPYRSRSKGGMSQPEQRRARLSPEMKGRGGAVHRWTASQRRPETEERGWRQRQTEGRERMVAGGPKERRSDRLHKFFCMCAGEEVFLRAIRPSGEMLIHEYLSHFVLICESV